MPKAKAGASQMSKPSKRISCYIASHPHRDRDRDHHCVGSTYTAERVINSQTREKGRQRKIESLGCGFIPCSLLSPLFLCIIRVVCCVCVLKRECSYEEVFALPGGRWPWSIRFREPRLLLYQSLPNRQSLREPTWLFVRRRQ